jgi:hypothetical protein
MGRWEILGREYHDHEYDLLTVRIRYKNRTIENRYRIRKDEKRIPREELEERKVGETRTLDGGKWVEGTVRRVR